MISPISLSTVFSFFVLLLFCARGAHYIHTKAGLANAADVPYKLLAVAHTLRYKVSLQCLVILPDIYMFSMLLLQEMCKKQTKN